MTIKAIEKYSNVEIIDFFNTAMYSTNLYIDDCNKKEELTNLEDAKKTVVFLEEIFNEIINNRRLNNGKSK